jgi:hypothetical protein
MEWKMTCLDVKLCLKTLVNIRFVNNKILLQETLEYWDAIDFVMHK